MGTSVWYSSGEHLYKWDIDEDIVRTIWKHIAGSTYRVNSSAFTGQLGF